MPFLLAQFDTGNFEFFNGCCQVFGLFEYCAAMAVTSSTNAAFCCVT